MKTPTSYLFVTIDGGGNVPPMLGIAKELVRRGHRVVLLTEPCMESAVLSIGAEYRPFLHHFTRTDSSVDIFGDTAKGADEMASMENVILGPSKITFSETLRVVDDLQPDALVVDVLLPAALMAAELRKIPRAVVFHMPEYLPGPGRPPGMLGLKPGTSFPGKWRDRLLVTLWNKKMNTYLPLINGIRREHGLPAVKKVTDVLMQVDVRLILTLQSFDFPMKPQPENVRYTGPVIDDPHWTEEWQSPWPNNEDPLVVVGMSSTFMSQTDAIQRCIRALNDLPVRGLVTTGPAVDPEQFVSTDKVKVVRAVNHSAVFPHASAVITHAGHGTVMRALAHGLPLVCMPVGRDQKDNAVKVAHHDCGIKLNPKSSIVAITKAVVAVLKDDRYRKAAAQWQKRIAESAGAETAADYLEQLSADYAPQTLVEYSTNSPHPTSVL